MIVISVLNHTLILHRDFKVQLIYNDTENDIFKFEYFFKPFNKLENALVAIDNTVIRAQIRLKDKLPQKLKTY